MDFSNRITEIIAADRSALRKVSDALWNRPELAFQEYAALAEAKNHLEKRGFAVTTPCCGLETAFRAESGRGTPVFAIAAEYDALPEIGHACGHNLICAAALGAFAALASLLKSERIPGKIVLLGTPGEESGGGKVKMLDRGCLEGIDAVMMVHPSFRTTPDTGSSAIRRFDVIFHGKAAHAAGAPELGINALDAVMLLFSGINAFRQQLPETARIHGIVTNGGQAPNIIPADASCRFFLRSTQEEWMEKLEHRFRNMVHGAELMSGARAEITPFHAPYRSRKPNPALNRVFCANAEKNGMTVVIPPRSGRGSSDFGDFSRAIPGIHPYFAITDHEIAGHSAEFCEASKSDFAFDSAMKAAAAMAETGLNFLTDAKFRAEVTEAFLKA